MNFLYIDFFIYALLIEDYFVTFTKSVFLLHLHNKNINFSEKSKLVNKTLFTSLLFSCFG